MKNSWIIYSNINQWEIFFAKIIRNKHWKIDGQAWNFLKIIAQFLLPALNLALVQIMYLTKYFNHSKPKL